MRISEEGFVLPPRIFEAFGRVPEEIIGLCRPHPWGDLTTPPRDGMRSIRDILLHMVSAERYWIRHVIHGEPRRRPQAESYPDLGSILTLWAPQRRATLDFVAGLDGERRLGRRPFPWDAAQTASIGEIIWHVVSHEQYHRGQVFTRLVLLGRRDLPDHDLLR